MKTQKAVETHNAIVDAAETLFMKKSVEKVTIDEITRQAGVAKGTFYLYFGSKDALVWHFMEHKLDALLQIIGAIGTCGYSKEELFTLIDTLIGRVKEHETLLKLVHQVRFYNFLGRKNIEKRLIDNLVEPVYEWMSRGKREGKLAIGDARFAAYFFTTSIHNMIEYVLNQEAPYTMDDLGVNFKSMLSKLLIEG